MWNNYVTILSILISIITIIAADADCGKRKVQSSIALSFNGTLSYPGQFPWLAPLFRRGKGYICGSSIISKWHLLTAAHCVSLDPINYHVLLGRFDISNSSETNWIQRNVGEIFINENYNSNAERQKSNGDIAVLKLSNEINFNDYIQPICLPQPSTDPVNIEGIIAGYGKTEVYGDHVNQPSYVRLKSIGVWECLNKKHIYTEVVSERSYCVGNKDAISCQGDSGGGYYFFDKTAHQHTIYGIVSYGIGDCDPREYIVLVDVTKFIPWIDEKVKASTPKKPTPRPRPTFDNTKFYNFNRRRLTYDRELALNIELFSLKLLTYTIAYVEEQNLFIAPFSIYKLLAAIAEGSNENTFKELNDTLGLINMQRTRDFGQYIELALNKINADITSSKFNAVIGDQNRPIDREYEDVLERIYDIEYIPVNYRDTQQTLREVNGKISQSTNGQIKDILSINDLEKQQLVLLSAVYFDGKFKHSFNSTFTKRELFYYGDEKNTMAFVNMMSQRGSFEYAFDEHLGCSFIELPYDSKSGDQNSPATLSLILALPKVELSLADAINNIYRYGIERILLELENIVDVEVSIPKFDIETSIDMTETLKGMGIKDVFDAQLANLSKINKNYYAASVKQKTKIRVSEDGNASASSDSSNSAPNQFKANRPFIYFVVDKAIRHIIAAGVYKNPELV